MKLYRLYREHLLPTELKTAWDFFSTPENLARITPPELGFEILTEVKGKKISDGMHIEYYVRPLLGLRLKWITRIDSVQEPKYFVDTQLKGPYKLWEHKHTFVPTPHGVNMIDEVKYAMPFGILGRIAHALFLSLIHISEPTRPY